MAQASAARHGGASEDSNQNASSPPLPIRSSGNSSIKMSVGDRDNSSSNFDTTVVPVVGATLGKMMPNNVQDLLEDWFKARDTTVLPKEIYCIQSHRVYNTTGGKRVVYVSYRTGHPVEIRAYIHPTMRGANCSERLLVVNGHPFPRPFVLARTKPHSNDFRQWLGVRDQGTGPALVRRFVPDQPETLEAKRRAECVSDATTAKRHKVIKPKREVLDTDHGGRVSYSENEDVIKVDPSIHGPPVISIRTHHTPARSHHNLQCSAPVVSALRDVDMADDLPQPTSTVAEHTTIHFISSVTGETARRRTLAKIENVESLFAHAFAADAVVGSMGLAVLEAAIGDQGPAIRIVDGDDYQELIKAVVLDKCWERDMGCDIYVTGLGSEANNVG